MTIPNETNDPIINSEISVGFLTVNSGVEIVIQDGGTLNIYYGFDHNGTITVEDGGALIYHNCNSPITGSGSFNIDRNSPSYSGTKFFSYWSSPVVELDSNIGTVFPVNPFIYYFNSSVSNATWALNGTTNFLPGTGYAVRSESAGSFSATFSGMINEGGIDVTTYFNTNEESTDPGNVWSTEGDNLIGNPYASAIDWDRVITDTDNNHLEGTIYFWSQNTAEIGDNNVSDYLQYNLTGGGTNTATGKIASMQGFFVRSLSAGTVNFKPTHQIAANNDQIFRNSENDTKKIGRSWFSMRKDGSYSSMLVGFVNGATKSYDRLYDAPFDVNNQTLGLFSLVEGNKRTSIQGRPKLKGKKKVVKLGFVVAKPGEYTIQLDEEHINPKYYIYLRDRQEKKTIDMRSTSYQFQVDTIGENLNRFKSIYTKKKRNNALKSELVKEEEELLLEDLTTYVNRADELIVELESVNDEIDKVQLFDINGRQIAQFFGSQSRNVTHIPSGIYILVVGLESGKRMTKKMAIIK